MNDNLDITYHKCTCKFCKKYNSGKGYFIVSDDHDKFTTSISVLISIIQSNEFRFMFYIHIMAYENDIIPEAMYEKIQKVVLKGEISETRMVGVDKKRN